MTKIKKFATIYAITHCESCYNQKGIFTGRVNSILTKKGHEHAEQLAQELKNVNIDIAYISPLIRTKETLKHIQKYHPNIKVCVEKRIIERDYGELSRKNKAKYASDHPDLFPVYHRSYDIAPPDGESIKQVEKRVLPFIKEITNLVEKKKVDILIVCHSNSLRPIRKYFENLSIKEMMSLEHMRHKIFKYKISLKKDSI
jgi:2,3-bisphosphoglycerate-dependent phosphoglycerate mutase